MPRARVPLDAGPFSVFLSSAGTFGVISDRTGVGKVVLPCKTRERAEDLCEKLNDPERDEEVCY